MNPYMDPLGDLQTTRPIQTDWECTVKPYPSWWFRFIGNLDSQFRNGLVSTQNRMRSDAPEPLLALAETIMRFHTRLLRPSTNVRPFLLYKLHSLRHFDIARDDAFLLPWMFKPKDVHLRRLAT